MCFGGKCWPGGTHTGMLGKVQVHVRGCRERGAPWGGGAGGVRGPVGMRAQRGEGVLGQNGAAEGG